MSDAASRGSRAKALIEDPLLVEVLEAVEAAAINAWRSTSTAQAAEREVAWHSLKAIERVRAGLKSIADDGKIEAARRVVRLGAVSA